MLQAPVCSHSPSPGQPFPPPCTPETPRLVIFTTRPYFPPFPTHGVAQDVSGSSSWEAERDPWSPQGLERTPGWACRGHCPLNCTWWGTWAVRRGTDFILPARNCSPQSPPGTAKEERKRWGKGKEERSQETSWSCWPMSLVRHEIPVGYGVATAIPSCIFPVLSEVKDDWIYILLGWWEKTEFWESWGGAATPL